MKDMSIQERKQHWITLRDWGASELDSLLDLASRLKKDPLGYRPLEGKTLAMIFHKASTRTRISFEVGTFQLGGHALMISAGTVENASVKLSLLPIALTIRLDVYP